MKLSTRLLLPLLATVTVVMTAYGVWAMVQRQSTLRAESEREIRAYATALGLALERALQDPERGRVTEIVERVGREPAIYGVLVYGAGGEVVHVSDPLRSAGGSPDDALRRAFVEGITSTSTRVIDDVPVASVIRPLLNDAGVTTGALEVVAPLADLVAEQARIRQRFVLNTLTLLAASTLVMMWLVRRHVSGPVDRFVHGVRALAGGELEYRLDPDLGVGELGEVAGELNRMADRLQAAREDLLREAEERVELERRLQQSEKLAEIGSLAAGLAHEIGAPLHVIRGRTDLLLTKDPPSEDRERNLRIVIEQIDRISHIVRNLLGYARRREPRHVPVDLSEVVRGVAEFLEAEAARTGTRMELGGATVEAPVRGDPDLLHQVLLNLAMNGLHAVEEQEEGERRLRIRVGRVGGEGGSPPGIAVEVDDSGPGIPPELRHLIFDPFFTTKGGRKGTGLGLAVARDIVADHGGTLEVVDPPAEDEGGPWSTRLRVVFPASHSAKEGVRV